MNTLSKNIILFPLNLMYKISPKFVLKLLFRFKQGYKLNLSNPKSYNEKLQWIKLNYKNEWMPKCCDKYEVREYIKYKNCSELLNDLLWEGFNPYDIPYDKLPEKFVIKVTHGSTFNIIVKDKNTIDKKKITKSLNKWLRAKFIPCYGEWFYGKVKPRIIVEKYLENENFGELLDFKVFCFNGKAKLIDVHSGRFSEHKRNVYDRNWNLLNDVYFKYDHFEGVDKPEVLDDLIKYAEILSSDFLHARVDFFIVDSKIIFGEITFTNGAGFDKIRPIEFDYEMGSYLDLK